jgi:Protein of unknown function (DUF3179)
MTRPAMPWVIAAGALVAAAVVVGLPVWLIQPFAPQTPDAVAWSWQLRQHAPRITVAMTLLALAAAASLWLRPSVPGWRTAVRRSSLVLIVTLTAATAWFARQNHFEWMFRPFPDPRFVAAAEAGDVPAEAPVLGVANDAASLAFPITRIGYHHLVNATLGDVPIVATY